MKYFRFAILCLSIMTDVFAQNKLVFNNEHVVSISFMDYKKSAHGDSCMLCYIDTSEHLMVTDRLISIKTEIYEESMKEMQNLLDEIGHNRNPSAEDFGIFEAVAKKKLPKLGRKSSKEKYMFIRKRIKSLDTFNIWLQKKFPVYDEGTVLINTIQDPYGVKIIIHTDKKKYFFDMRDIELFQPYLMRTSDRDCLKYLTNFCINKHLYNIFKLLKIDRKIPFVNEIIESYNVYCTEGYDNLQESGNWLK